jgi:hypothetical protein
MSGGYKAVQGGVRVKLPAGVTWDMLSSMAPDEVRQRDQMAAQLFEWESGSGQDPQLRAFAAQVLPTVLRRLELASAIEIELAACPPEHAASGTSRPERKPTMAR